MAKTRSKIITKIKAMFSIFAPPSPRGFELLLDYNYIILYVPIYVYWHYNQTYGDIFSEFVYVHI